jgi:hypothetical protein
MIPWKIIEELRASPTCTVPIAGAALGNLKRGPAYQAAKDGTLGVDTFWIGGKLRVATIDVLRKLKLDDADMDNAGPAKTESQVEPPPPITPEPALRRSRKTMISAAAPLPQSEVAARKPRKAREKESAIA